MLKIMISFLLPMALYMMFQNGRLKIFVIFCIPNPQFLQLRESSLYKNSSGYIYL